ncbi:MAG TPA: VOC family protein [Stellaceae bacterium]|nr:VOC family protein [Stellaceae bacterium]
MPPAPGFHHLHLNTTDPEAAIDFYTRAFPSTRKGSWGGLPALLSPNEAMILFDRVERQPPTAPQSPIWHFGWHVTDSRATLEGYKKRRREFELLPLYTGEGDAAVLISSDALPGSGGVLGLTKAQLTEARAEGVRPTGVGGFAYMRGPDGALVEYAGNHPAERFNHIHFYQEQPLAAEAWYVRHLNARPRPVAAPAAEADRRVPRGPDRTFPALDRDGMFRSPRGGVEFGDVALIWYMNQGEAPLTPSRGQLYDHFALSVADLDGWARKLEGEGVALLDGPYPLGDTRALMIEGPSREAIELVEVG